MEQGKACSQTRIALAQGSVVARCWTMTRSTSTDFVERFTRSLHCFSVEQRTLHSCSVFPATSYARIHLVTFVARPCASCFCRETPYIAIAWAGLARYDRLNV
jgi:hypothetical protein